MSAAPPPNATGLAVPADRLAAYLAGRRWSGARGGELHVLGGGSAGVVFHEPSVQLFVERVRVDGGAPYELLMPLVVRPVTHADVPPAADRLADDGGTAVFDATFDAEFRLRLLDALRGAAAFAGDAVVARAPDPDAIPSVRTSRVGTVEQSNTSIVYDGAIILKLFRRVEVGENPDVEIGRFLTERGFAHVPRLYGTVTLRRAGGEATIAMAQALVPGAEDAWAYAVRAAGDALGGRADAAAYAAEAGRLGAVTRALHDALAGDAAHADFAPEPARLDDVRRWAAGAHAAYDAMHVAADAAGTRLPGAVLDRAGALAPVDAAAAEAGDDAGTAIRHHGDYHLGQVLRAADGRLFVVDFEGEPARPLAERRRKHSPLRDVAGMLRSFAYAAAFAARERATDAAHGAAWERAARDAFVAAYFGPGPAPYLPRARAHADALVRLFELEKLFYELRYELQNRPDWVGIPLAGLARLAAPAL
ncbi:aminoglycoside phosphotransferase [Gemmatimonadetes bacterium T265]|nr:aminoglycoside phosphotransferase [Gemmatimonadetes bacterium T265]